MADNPSESQASGPNGPVPQRSLHGLRAPDAEGPRSELAKSIPRRPRVSWWLGLVFAFVFALLAMPTITSDRWLAALGAGKVVENQPASLTVRVPALSGFDTRERHFGNGGIVIGRGEIATAEDARNVATVAAATPRGPLPYFAFFLITFVLAALFTHHMRRSTRGRLVRVQIVSLISIVVVAILVKLALLATSLSVLVVPIAVLAIVPTIALDRIVGLATGILAALVVGLLGPFDVGISILLLVQAATAGLVVAEQPKDRWRAALTAGVATTVCTLGTYMLLSYLTHGTLPVLRDPLHSPWFAAAIGPAIATLLAVPLVPIYQLLVGEITRSKLIELEDLENPLLKQIAERAPGTWQHSLMMANMAQIAANAIGANGRLVRVGALYHDLGKSLQPKYFIENLDPGETSPHDQLPPEVSCDAIFAHVTEGLVCARKAGLHERIVDFMHMHHGNGVLEYFWGKTKEIGNPHGLSIEQFRYPGHPPQSRETAILAICDAVEAASRTLKKPDAASIDSLVQRIVYGKLHLGQLDESGLSMSDLRRVADSLRETIRHANHGRIEYPWQKAQQDASATKEVIGTQPRLDSLDREPAKRETSIKANPPTSSSQETTAEVGLAATADVRSGKDVGTLETAPSIPRTIRGTDAPANEARTREPSKPPPIPEARTKESSKPPASSAADARAKEPSKSPASPAPDARAKEPSQPSSHPADARAREPSQSPASPAPDARAKEPSKPPAVDARAKEPSQPSSHPAEARAKELSSSPAAPDARAKESSSSSPAAPDARAREPSQPPILLETRAKEPSQPPAEETSRRRRSSHPPIDPISGGRPANVVPDDRSDRARAPSQPPSFERHPPSQPPPELITAATFGSPPPTAARKRAATLPPIAPARRAPTVPPHVLGRRAPTVPPVSRSGGPPPGADLENAITNPPPLRHGPSNGPSNKPSLLIVDGDDDDVRITDESRNYGATSPAIKPAPPSPFDDEDDEDGPVTQEVSLDPAVTAPFTKIKDSGSTEPSMPRFTLAPGTELRKPAPAGLAARVDAKRDEWSIETPVIAPTAAELRALLGSPDPTRQQSIDEIEALHRRGDEEVSEPDVLQNRRFMPTSEVDPDDIESAIEIAPPARRAPNAIAVAKPSSKKSE